MFVKLIVLIYIVFGVLGTTHLHDDESLPQCECITGIITETDINCATQQNIIQEIETLLVSRNCINTCGYPIESPKFDLACNQLFSLLIQYHDWCELLSVDEVLFHDLLDVCYIDCEQAFPFIPSRPDCPVNPSDCEDSSIVDGIINTAVAQCDPDTCMPRDPVSSFDCLLQLRRVEGIHRLCSHHDITENFDTLFDTYIEQWGQCDGIECNVFPNVEVNCSSESNTEITNLPDWEAMNLNDLGATIKYPGNGTVTFGTQDEWGIEYYVGQWCDGIFEVELVIDLIAMSPQADAVFAFGTETTYFAVFVGYDGSFWIPYPQVEGDIWVLPDPGLPLIVDNVVPLSDPTKLGDPSQGNSLTAREGLTVPMGDLLQWERLFCCGGPFAQNISPFKIKVKADANAGTTEVTFYKGTATQSTVYSSAFPKDTPIKLYIAADSGDIRLMEVFKLNSIIQTGTPNKLDCPGTPSEPPCLCPCYCIIPDNRDYCSSGCCDVGLVVKTLSGSPVNEYFLDESNQECFTSIDGVESERISLTQDQYCACESILGDAANDANCSISEIPGKSIFAQLSELFGHSNPYDINYFLVTCYGIFIILSLVTVIFIVYQCFRCAISLAFKNNIEYKQLNGNASSITIETDN